MILNFKGKESEKDYAVLFKNIRISRLALETLLQFDCIIEDKTDSDIYFIECSGHCLLNTKEKNHILDRFSNVIHYLQKWGEKEVSLEVTHYHRRRLQEAFNDYYFTQEIELKIKGEEVL